MVVSDYDLVVIGGGFAGGEPIPGLYAAGKSTGLFYHKQPPGTLVLRANTFGRIIGANVAESLPDTAATRG